MTQAVLMALDVIDETPACLRSFCGLTLLERNLRLLRYCGVTRAIVLTASPAAALQSQISGSSAAGLEVDQITTPVLEHAGDENHALVCVRGRLDDTFVALRADHVYDRRALEAILSAQPNTSLVSRRPPSPAAHLPGSGPAAAEARETYDYGLRLLRRDDLAPGPAGSEDRQACLHLEELPSYIVNMRRELPVACFAVKDEADERLGWRILIDATQKGTLDWPAQVLHPVPENYLVRALLPTPVTPNHVTIVSNLCAFIAIGFFWRGDLASAVALALAVGVLDGVDGKLARIKLLYSRFGDRLDHVLDVIYEPLWYLALGAHLSAGGILAVQQPFLLALGIVALYFVDRATTGLFKRLKKVELFDRAPVDRFFRQIGARRNTNVLILLAGLLSGFPLGALWTVFGLTAVTALFHGIRAIQMRHLQPEDGA